MVEPQDAKGPGSLNHGLEGSQSGTPTLDGAGGKRKSPSCLRHRASLGLLVTAAMGALTDTATAPWALKAESSQASQCPTGCVTWTSYKNLSGLDVLRWKMDINYLGGLTCTL